MLFNNDLYEKAQQLYRNRQFKDALSILERMNKISPGNESVEFLIGKIKLRNHKTAQEAKEIFTKIITYGNYFVASSLIELGRIEVGNRNYDKARAYFNKSIKRENNVLAHVQLAKLEIKVGDYDKAVEILENLISTIGEDHKYYNLVLFHLTTANRRRGTLDKAQECLEKLKSAQTNRFNDEWILLEQSKIEQANNNIDAALEILYKIINTSVHDIVLEELVKLYINYERYDLAYKYNNEILKRQKTCSRFNIANIDAFLKHKLGIELDEESKNIYFVKQLYSYSKEEAIKHISQHLDENEEKLTHSVYCEDINIEQLYNYALEKINELEPIEEGINDKYIIRCNRIVGLTIDNHKTDTVKIVVIPNTKDIITIYPIPAINNKLEIENDYTSSKQKVRESQLDKFKRRYAKNS